MSCSTAKNTNWHGMRIGDSSQTTVNCAVVNQTGWDGIKLHYATQVRVVATNITNVGWRLLDCSGADGPCTDETPPNLNCSCNNKDTCSSALPNFLTPQVPEESGDDTSIDVDTCSQQVNYVTPTSPAGISCPGQPCLTLDQHITS